MVKTDYNKVQAELRKVFVRKRNKKSLAAAEKVVEGCELVLSKFGFHPVKEGGVVWTDGSVFAHISLCQRFNGEWVADAWLVTRPASVKLYAKGQARNSRTLKSDVRKAKALDTTPRRTAITEGEGEAS
jgi:hypothetical protein